MAEEPAPLREGQTQPFNAESSRVNNDFWTRLRRVEDLVEEAQQIIAELRAREVS